MSKDQEQNDPEPVDPYLDLEPIDCPEYGTDDFDPTAGIFDILNDEEPEPLMLTEISSSCVHGRPFYTPCVDCHAQRTPLRGLGRA